MSIIGIPDEVKAEVRFRSNDKCECRNSRHQFIFDERCDAQINNFIERGYFVLINKRRFPTADNVMLICSHCLSHCCNIKATRKPYRRRY